MDHKKRILMLAHANVIEGLRMATGLTLLDDEVTVVMLAEPHDQTEAEAQLDALEFADVHVERMLGEDGWERLAEHLDNADVVYAI